MTGAIDPDEIAKLRKINAALIERVERSMDQQGNAFSLFQTAIGLESQVRQRTDELTATLRRLEQTNRALSAAKEAAEAANISKTRFIAAASHDVLQPLNAAHLSISALSDLQTTAQGRALVHQVEQSLETMNDLLRTLLDISRLDSGVMRPDVTSLPLDTILDSLRSDFQPIAAAKDLHIRFRPTNAIVRSDRSMLRRILQNIISNAIRYTKTGGVLIGSRRRGAMLRIDIVDTGIGIPADQFEAIFEEFHRGTIPAGIDTAHQAGLGLGLSIVQRMVSTLGHHIAFTSKEGHGTAFHLYVPFGQAHSRRLTTGEYAPKRPTGNSLFGTNVILVENDRAVMEAMLTLLESWHCSVRMASNASDAISFLADADWRPDIVIADQHLDEGDLGSDTIEHIRYYLRRPVPALIVTADPSPKLVERCRAIDVEVMLKPLKPAQLRALMAHMLAAGRQT
ncbi:hybrid sensor histidine kinase/response regulator [Pararhizobium haloflavum]|uniref:hybrid sensor histidine kinase/response regulator n=1 Tax=Pararhizobium haloflavum TaxID=2037914 RepID=UPI001FE087AD|nr:hybrid sensor histidine kinase/response regulator [Pararhizobium haloflavum]